MLLRILDKGRTCLENAEILVLCLLLGGMLSLAFLQVVLRQFHSGILWADVVIRHMVLWTAIVGSALAASRTRHITIDALGRLFSGNAAKALRIGTNLFSAWICYQLAIASRDFVSMTIEFGDRIDSLDMLAWPLQIVIPIGFALICFHFLLDIPLTFLSKSPATTVVEKDDPDA
jgi:TRAP-type C4-dicarboxylate transport system permease small subunit